MFQFSPYIFLNLSAGIVSLIIGYLIWQRRPGPGVNAFVGMCIFVAIQAFGSTFELITATQFLKILAVNIIYLGVIGVPAFWFAFVLGYTNREHWLTQRTIALLLIHPILVTLLVWTNQWHGLFWSARPVTTVDGLVVNAFEQGSLWWFHTGYSYLLIVLSAILLVRALIKSPDLYRGQMVLLLAGTLMPTAVNMLFIFGLSPLPPYVDATPTAFLVSGMLMGWALYRFRLMDIIPVARDVIVDGLADAIIVIDGNNRIVDINPKALEIFGLQKNAIIGERMIDTFTQHSDLISKFGNTEEAEAEIALAPTSKNEERIFTMRISPLRNQRGEVTARIINLSDITALKRINRELKIAREKAEEATQLKSQFLATMSHELRTPLNAIIGYSELMLTGMVGDLSDKHYQYQERVTSNSHHLLNLINDILDISKIEAGRMELVNQPFTIKTWLDDVTTQNAVLAEEKSLAFNVDFDEELPTQIMGDEARLRQVVTNLLSNAFKFTHEGHVALTVRRNDSATWRIEVQDTGIGIPPHKQETIFEEFQQADNSSTREYGGTGLGLAIVRQFVLMMGGHIRVSSEIGKGSTFTVILPLIDVEIEMPEKIATQ